MPISIACLPLNRPHNPRSCFIMPEKGWEDIDLINLGACSKSCSHESSNITLVSSITYFVGMIIFHKIFPHSYWMWKTSEFFYRTLFVLQNIVMNMNNVKNQNHEVGLNFRRPWTLLILQKGRNMVVEDLQIRLASRKA